MRPAAATTAALLATVVCLGRLLHYGDLRVYGTFLVLAAIAGTAAWRVASAADTADGDFPIRVSVAFVAVVVLCGLTLGAARWLSSAGFVAAELVCAAIAFALPRRRADAGGSPRSGPPALAVGAGVALVAFAIGFAATHAPLTLYDSVSYHLHFSARWLQDRAISIVPTPFSDEAQAYAPANGELFFAWLMAPFHGDLLARMGQLPFALLAAALLWVLGRRLGARPEHAVYPPLFFLLSRQVVEQMVGANVDLICASLFLAAIYFGLVAVERGRAADWAWFGATAGLYAGSKYVALVYTPILVAIALHRRPGRRMLWALPGIVAFGLPWYARNWIEAGSPIYPASLQVAGITIARGAFTHAAMMRSVFHTTDLRLVPVIAAHAFGPALFVFALPFLAAGAIRMVRRGWWPHGLVAVLPLLMAPLYWFALPVNIDSRFFMPAVGPMLLVLAFVFGAGRRWNAVVHALYAGGIAWLIVGAKAAVPWHTPWFMDGWLALDGLIASAFVPWFFALALVVAAAWWSAGQRWRVTAVAAICGASAVVLAVGGERWCQPGRCDAVQVTSPYIRGNLLFSWHWIDDHVHGATIAYTGINLPYPLTGPQLTNRVVYANIDGHSRWRFHDYDRAYRAGRFEPSTPPLAAASGELMPVRARTGPRDDAPRPRYERMKGVRDGWMYNLERLEVNYLYVSALSAYEIGYEWHDGAGFPIEDTWAASDPAHFRLVYENPQVHIYAVTIPGGANA